MAKKVDKKSLMARTEKLAIQLIDEAMGVRVAKAEDAEGMQFSERRAALCEATRFLAIKHRINPDQEESEFASLQEELNGTSRTPEDRTNGFATAADFGAGPDPDIDSDTDEFI